jgi:hypothetical protein
VCVCVGGGARQNSFPHYGTVICLSLSVISAAVCLDFLSSSWFLSAIRESDAFVAQARGVNSLNPHL